MEAQIFKLKESLQIDGKNVEAFGKIAATETPAFKGLMEWASKKEEDILRELAGAATNPALNERIIGIYLGEWRSVRKDLMDFVNYAVIKYQDSLKENA
jgi:hypothetical protein